MTYRPILIALLAVVVPRSLPQAATARGGHARRHGRRASCSCRRTSSTGNRIAVYDRGPTASSTPAGTYPTGGLGGDVAAGHRIGPARVAGLAGLRPGAPAAARCQRRQRHGLGFPRARRPAQAERRRVLGRRSSRPASASTATSPTCSTRAAPGSSRASGSAGTALAPIAGSARSLGLANTNPPNFLMSPGQVGFTPDGHQLLVTTKASTSSIDVFQVGHDGLLSAAPVVNPSATPVPFAFTFDPPAGSSSGEAGASSVTTYRLELTGTLDRPEVAERRPDGTLLDPRVGGFYFVVEHRQRQPEQLPDRPAGQPSLLAAVAATTNPGPIDLASSGRFLYAETGTTAPSTGSASGDGALVPIGSVEDLPAGIEGIAAT